MHKGGALIRRGDTLIGKFKVEHVLGQGGMGTVVAARHIELDEMFAVKLLRAGMVQSERTVCRFVREARAAARLRSPHITRVYDVGRLQSGEPYMVMEFLHGSDLRALTGRHGPLPYEHAGWLVLQACDGIAEAHAYGIVHRDLKLDNLFLTHMRDGRPCLKVLDFGISKHADVSERLTHSGVLMGSPRYMSPEQMKDARAVDVQTDVWAMGVIFYELLTGRTPFLGADLPSIIESVIKSEPVSPRELCPQLPGQLNAAIMRCLAKRPENRFQTITELAGVIASELPPNVAWPEAYVTFADERTDEHADEPWELENEFSLPPGSMGTMTPAAARPVLVERRGAFEATQQLLTTSLLSDGDPLVFISCGSDASTDIELARSFAAALAALDVRAFVPALHDHGEGGTREWLRRVTVAIEGCDVFVLLLSEQAAVSELLASQLALAQELRARTPGRPHLLAVHIGSARGDARSALTSSSVLDSLASVPWSGPDDTTVVIRAILERLGRKWPARTPTVGFAGARPIVSLPPVTPRLELPGGIVRANSPFYVERKEIEQRCLRELVKPGALVRIKGPQRMGKTSLMMHLLDHATNAGMRVSLIDLQLVDSNILSDLERFLRWLCAIIARRLSLPRVTAEWDDIFGPKDNCTAHFEDHFFGSGTPLVLALNHVDRLFNAPELAEEFLVLVRAWHEMAKSQGPWEELRLILGYSTEMYMPLDVNHSPFNVGLAISLADWDAQTVLELAHRHGLAWSSRETDKLMHLIGGHPHLTRIALHHLAETGADLDEVLATAASDQGLFADHVKHLLWHLERRPALASAAAQVMRATKPIRIETELAFKLVSLGVVYISGDLVSPGRELYRRYLTARLSPTPAPSGA